MVVDILIVVVMVASTAVGAVTGFVWQVTGLVALIVGTFSAWVLSGVLGAPLGRFLDLGEGGGQALAFFLVFGFVSLGLRVVASVAKVRVDKYRLERHNRLWGGVAGAAKGLLISMVVVSVLGVMGQGGDFVGRSFLGRNLAAVGTLLLPPGARTAFERMLDRVENRILPQREPHAPGSPVSVPPDAPPESGAPR
ncbi:MAG: CvpA family protein [Planctomycetes bacterium]|nr:CvpA family protein [Planctomycetota bacterium]